MVNISLNADQFKVLTWCISEIEHSSFVKDCFPEMFDAAFELEGDIYLAWAESDLNPNNKKEVI